MGITERVKRKLGITDDSRDAEIADAVEDATGAVLHYCNLSELSDGLISVIANMAVDVLRQADEQAGGMAGVTGIKVGDTSLSFGAARDSWEAVLLAYAADLHHYRRVRWP